MLELLQRTWLFQSQENMENGNKVLFLEAKADFVQDCPVFSLIPGASQPPCPASSHFSALP